MKRRIFIKGIFLISLIFGTIFIGCEMEPELTPEPTYTIYVNTFTFSSTDSLFGGLQDGYYITYDLSKADFDWEKANNFQNRLANVWTEDQIYSFLIGWGGGFGNSQARELTTWLTTVNYGLIATRQGSLLHVLIKE